MTKLIINRKEIEKEFIIVVNKGDFLLDVSNEEILLVIEDDEGSFGLVSITTGHQELTPIYDENDKFQEYIKEKLEKDYFRLIKEVHLNTEALTL